MTSQQCVFSCDASNMCGLKSATFNKYVDSTLSSTHNIHLKGHEATYFVVNDLSNFEQLNGLFPL